MLRSDVLEHLPPVCVYWDAKDLDNLTQEELEKIQLMLRLKMEAVTDRYERKLFYNDREQYMRLKMRAYKQTPPKRDYPF
jgi:hypothetical protein